MRRVTFLAIFMIALAAPTFANTGRYDDKPSFIRSFLIRIIKALDLDHISLPPG
jgi:hypothetical protein